MIQRSVVQGSEVQKGSGQWTVDSEQQKHFTHHPLPFTLLLAFAFHCTLFTVHCFSSGPNFIAKQGQLRTGGQPANGPKKMWFRLCTSANDESSSVWSTADAGVDVYCINGMFNYPLSVDKDTKQIKDLDFANNQYYMAMSVDGTNWMKPFEPMAALPYAFCASTATNLRGNGHIRITGTGPHYVESGNVGIGTTDPSTKLTVMGAGGVDSMIQAKNSSYLANTGARMWAAGDGHGILALGNASGTDGVNISGFGDTVFNGGNVGIGVGSPVAKLDVAGGYMRARYDGTNNPPSSGEGIEIMYPVSGRGNISSYNRGAGAYQGFWIDGSTVVINSSSNGRVGIGTTAPDLVLDVESSNATAFTGIEITNTDTTTRRWALLASNNAGSYAPAKGFGIRDISAGSTRLVINTNGNVGIGVNSPLGPLSVGNSAVSGSDGFIVIGKNGTGGTRHWRVGFDESFNFILGDYGYNNNAGTWIGALKFNWNTPANTIVTNANGNVGIGTTNPLCKFHVVDGQIGTNTLPQAGGVPLYSLNGYFGLQSSDRRLKKDIANLTDGLNMILRLQGIRFRYDRSIKKNMDDKVHVGMIAQDVKEVLPEVVFSSMDEGVEYYGIDYAMFTPVLVEAVKQLKSENDAKANKIELLEQKIKEFELRLERLEK